MHDALNGNGSECILYLSEDQRNALIHIFSLFWICADTKSNGLHLFDLDFEL